MDEKQPIPETLSITLRRPVKIGDVEYAVMTLREPTAGEMIQLDKLAGWKADVQAISLISGIPRAAVIKIGERDARRASEYLGRFFPAGRSTGADD